jgi:hypothetical protein
MIEKIGDLWRIGAARVSTHEAARRAATAHSPGANKADFTALFVTNSVGRAARQERLLNLKPTVKW